MNRTGYCAAIGAHVITREANRYHVPANERTHHHLCGLVKRTEPEDPWIQLLICREFRGMS